MTAHKAVERFGPGERARKSLAKLVGPLLFGGSPARADYIVAVSVMKRMAVRSRRAVDANGGTVERI